MGDLPVAVSPWRPSVRRYFAIGQVRKSRYQDGKCNWLFEPARGARAVVARNTARCRGRHGLADVGSVRRDVLGFQGRTETTTW